MTIRRLARRLGVAFLAGLFLTSFMTPIAGAAPGGAKLEFVAGGFEIEVMALVEPPGDDRLFVVERHGYITIVEPDGTVLATPFLNVDPIAQSLNGLVFHPDFESNRLFYIYTVQSLVTQIVEYEADAGNPNIADTSTRRVILERQRQSNNHKGGQMEFGADGYLYVSIGDGGPPPGDPFENGQDITTIDGSIIRIDHVTGAGAPGNPFIGVAGDDAIWVYGLRHPWRFSFDDATGLMYVGDVGDGAREEIDVIAPSQAGANFGWDVMEGTSCFEPPQGNEAPCNDPSYTMPDLEYTHQEGCSVIGGYVYHGTAIPQLQDQYIYADYCEGWIKTFEFVGGAVTNEQDWTATLGALPFVTTFGEDNDGELYVAADGDVYRIVADGPPPAVGTIRGTVWSDDDGNGLQGGAEPLVAGVDVELWVDSDKDGTADIQLDSKTSGSQGNYAFPGLAITETYVVRVDAPVGSMPTTRDVGNDDTIDSDADPATGFTGPITLRDGEVDNTVDFGLVPAEVATIAGRTWRDSDGDGIQDAGEPGFAGLWAWLYIDAGGDPGAKIDAVTMDGDGNYTFDVDPASAYHVLLGQQIFIDGELKLVLPNRTIRSPQDQGPDDARDSDTSPVTGFAGPISVVDGEVNDTVDGGFVPLAAGYPELVAEDGAVAYWRFGENGGTDVIDIAGTNHGTVIGTPDWGQRGFVDDTDTALRLDGSTFIAIPDSPDINLGGPYEARSVEGWFIADDTEATQVLYEEGSTSRGLSLYIDAGRIYGGIWNTTDDDDTTPWSSEPFLSAPIAVGAAYHVVLTYDFAADLVQLHVNGELVDSDSGVGRWFIHTADIGIGAMNDGTRLHTGGRHSGDQLEFSGVIDEFAIYPTALNGAQIRSHYEVDPASFSCLGLAATIVGTMGDDVITGTAGRDVIFARGGDDIVKGLGGADTICGGAGNDVLRGGSGADTLIGGSGADVITGDAGQDRLLGGPGHDRLSGGTEADKLRGGTHADVLGGGAGNDILAGGSGHDEVWGGLGNDILGGNKGHDALKGGAGSDRCSGDSGFATMAQCESYSGTPIDVQMIDFAFSPDDLLVTPGSTVRWENVGEVDHTTTSGANDPRSRSWDSGSLSSGMEFAVTFDVTGKSDYFCSIHPGMTASVTVSAPAMPLSGAARSSSSVYVVAD